MELIKHTHLGVYGVLVINHRVLLIKKARGPHTGKWDFPGGSIEFGEEPYETLKREFWEETGITSLKGELQDSISYTLIYPYSDTQLEELHHIGIIYEVELLDLNYELKTDGDEQDSLGAQWIDIEQLNTLELTPFVKKILLGSY
ncbi:NUDIX domain-containing protein [Paenibacillus sp. FSL F4-0125]|uniref:NUDIX hydrolase n=1 Tax=Paenibacillus sp. FSL F4-0125 TaxID=2954730 RepID=UPI0030F8E72E